MAKESPYARAMRSIRKEKRQARQQAGVMSKKAQAVGRCGAKRKTESGNCRLPAGYGTVHPGLGHCKHHGGSTPSGITYAAKIAAGNIQMDLEDQFMGHEIEMNPLDAIIWCIKITAGEVEWLGKRMAMLEEKEFLDETFMGKQLHIYAQERQKAVANLAKYSNMAVSLGLAERAIKLAETYGEAIATLLRGVTDDLELSKEQQEKLPYIIRKHLVLLEGGRAEIGVPALGTGDIIEGTAREVA